MLDLLSRYAALLGWGFICTVCGKAFLFLHRVGKGYADFERKFGEMHKAITNDFKHDLSDLNTNVKILLDRGERR